ncbi:LLM class flavin-dependent oxidoreductase [Pseudoclavibacter chungangensis]|uniref:LLM class flavin-dependent oxidoreductase n=1 Tax=Pseudoclavibacter chungangensis TaxID=587635 RepID=A0A7J5BYJ8_9MICO|nr:LLM class flavin-dependent oxidoreductase [Pseudoclavibacter chungangensis]KAB1659425.1 LLM class flavin-dependent oxidoreductase [Pseudoclavibacter chungangensis]NYJ67731.1 alkanesulfonate monooxygenase SsuD/methylene tetrahydromethanopterin reductase-like flavin-dependent oxidoreductase (luciferase family) [Pseudoclavibacter chungangensis]
MSRPFTVGIHIDGAGSHPAAWRDAGGDPLQFLGAAHARSVLARTEQAGLAYATLAGSHLPPATAPGLPARIDAVQFAAFGGPATGRLGLVPEVPVTYVEPFHTATQLASVDHAATGRSGWLVSTENSPEAARQYGREALDAAALAEETADVVRVVRRLLDSWEDDAVIRDLPTGRYIDRTKLHYVDFTGREFTVKGPAITPRPPQGQVPVFAHADAASGVDVDVVLVPAGEGLAERAEAARATGASVVVADLEILLDGRGERAVARAARLDELAPWEPGATRRLVGTAAELVDVIHELATHVDGVRLVPASLAQDLDELRFAVLPALADAGLLATDPHPTLRGALGLPRAENAFAAAGRN